MSSEHKLSLDLKRLHAPNRQAEFAANPEARAELLAGIWAAVDAIKMDADAAALAHAAALVDGTRQEQVETFLRWHRAARSRK